MQSRAGAGRASHAAAGGSLFGLRRRAGLALVVALALAASPAVHAALTQVASVFACGGRTRDVGATRIAFVVGQPVPTGVARAGRFVHYSGFLRPARTTAAHSGAMFMFW